MSKQPNTVVWLVSWDEQGLDGLVNVSKLEEQSNLENERITWETLKSTDETVNIAPNWANAEMNRIFRSMLLRAQVNGQRHYEIYSVGISSDMSEEYIKDLFNNSPQAIVDLIRERGTKHYSNRNTRKAVIS